MSKISIQKYAVTLKLNRRMLGTNPIGLDVMDKHILDRQRKLIADNSTINRALNKYLDAKQISKEKGELELSALRLKVEELLGRELSELEYDTLKAGDLKKFKEMKETLSELDEKGITCFFRDPAGESDKNGRYPIAIGSHMILGFMKAAGEAITRSNTAKKGTILRSTAYTHSIINQHVNVWPELIPSSSDVLRNEKGEIEHLQRPLRAKTAQGERISLAKSEVLPEGTEFSFTLEILENSPLEESHMKEIFSYGALKGLGQWRNAGFGQFHVVSFEKVS